MKEVLFRKAPYLEDGEIAGFLEKYKTKDNVVFAHTGFEFGGEIWTDAIIKNIIKKENHNEIEFWMFDKMSKNAFWDSIEFITYARKVHKLIPIKHLIYGVVILSKKEFEEKKFDKFIIEVVD